ncbi:hypothetical protein CRENBAI_016791 [Crenichthys baileyi]|uniref:Secreted protein n=1 Tax=Crenichthys baileyi TaxID=28760 RepID=A0AAV9SIX0_9TELE
MFRYRGFIVFFFYSCMVKLCLKTCRNNPYLLCCKMFACILVLQLFGAHPAGRKAPWRAALKDSAYYGKKSVRRNRVTLFSLSTTSPGNLRTIQVEAPIFFDQ